MISVVRDVLRARYVRSVASSLSTPILAKHGSEHVVTGFNALNSCGIIVDVECVPNVWAVRAWFPTAVEGASYYTFDMSTLIRRAGFNDEARTMAR